MRADDFAESLAKVPAGELRDVNMLVYHKWDNTRRFLDGVDTEASTLLTSGEGLKSWNTWSRNTRFHLENLRAALDQPGEWFLHRDGTLWYMPLPGQDMTRAEAVAPVAEKFLLVQGDAAGGKFVEHVTFRGLSFRHSQRLMPEGGFEASQAAAPIDAVVMLDGARDITFEDCEIGHISTYGIWFRKGVQRCTLRHSEVHDFGAGGVRIGEAGIPSNEAEHTGHITIDNNIIRHGGYIYPCAVGVWVGHSADNRITHNEIADLFYSGLSVGWRWGYGPSLAKRNTIEHNHVHHIGHGVLSDMGGIYTLGPSEGTVVRHNVFHDIHAYSYGGWGMYTDEGSSDILFENNLVYDVKTGGFHQHYGKNNIVRNNIMAFSKLQQLQATRAEEHLSFTLENNIVYYDEGALLSGRWEQVKHDSRNNVYWHAKGEPVKFMNHSLEAWQKLGHEAGSRIVDPKFADASKRDFRLAADSPAIALGFKPFDSSKAGVYGSEAWRRKAADAKYPPLMIAPSPPPLTIQIGFEDQKVGEQPGGFGLSVEKQPKAVSISDAYAAKGKQSMKVVDGADFEQSYNPHFMLSRVTYESGQIVNRYQIRIAGDTRLSFEWRDYSGGSYKTGPRLSIADGKLHLDKTPAIDLPVDAWVGLEIRSVLGGSETPRWDLHVTIPGREAIVLRDLPPGSPEFRKLTWVGFMSTATKPTAFYLDEFHLAPAPGK
jgi:hypothetical protein